MLGASCLLIVSNIGLKTNSRVMKPKEFLKSSIKEDFILNVNNDYRYMKTGYYVSLHAEVLGCKVIPSTESILDAYRTPIMLLRASRAGIPTTPSLLAGNVKQIISEFEFPVVVFPVNPFSLGTFRVAHNRSALYRAVKSLSMNYRYTVCAQPYLGNIKFIKSLFGICPSEDEQILKISRMVYEEFKLPVCNLVIQKFDGKASLCGIVPLKEDELSPEDHLIISSEISRNSGETYG